MCTLSMHTVSKESVEVGQLSAPVRLSLCLGGEEVVTRNVLPLQLLQVMHHTLVWSSLFLCNVHLSQESVNGKGDKKFCVEDTSVMFEGR